MAYGKLPDGADKQMQRQVEWWRTSGHFVGVELLAGPGCELAEKLQGKAFPFDQIPSLPIDGCTRSPCCGCCFVPVTNVEPKTMTADKDWKRWISYAVGLFILLVLYVSMTGCASHGVMVSDEQVKQFKKGETTEAQVLAALGRPTTISNFGGQRMLIYSGAYAQARPATFIPIVGPLVGGSDVRASTVMFRVVDGVVVDINTSQTNSGGGTGFAAGSPIDPVMDQPRK